MAATMPHNGPGGGRERVRGPDPFKLMILALLIAAIPGVIGVVVLFVWILVNAL
jgi:hypothetical protein